MTVPVASYTTRNDRARGQSLAASPVDVPPAAFDHAVKACATLNDAVPESNPRLDDDSCDPSEMKEEPIEISGSLQYPHGELWGAEKVLHRVGGQGGRDNYQFNAPSSLMPSSREKNQTQFGLKQTESPADKRSARKLMSDLQMTEKRGVSDEGLQESALVVDRQHTRVGNDNASAGDLPASVDEAASLTAEISIESQIAVGSEISSRRSVALTDGSAGLASSANAQILDMIQAQQATWERGKQMVVTGLRLMLRPDSLGEIEVSLKIEDGSIVVVLSTEKESTAGALQAASDQLTAGLTDIGFEQARLTIGSRKEFVEDHANTFSRAGGELPQSTSDQSHRHGSERDDAKRNSERHAENWPGRDRLPHNRRSSGIASGRVSGLYL